MLKVSTSRESVSRRTATRQVPAGGDIGRRESELIIRNAHASDKHTLKTRRSRVVDEADGEGKVANSKTSLVGELNLSDWMPLTAFCCSATLLGRRVKVFESAQCNRRWSKLINASGPHLIILFSPDHVCVPTACEQSQGDKSSLAFKSPDGPGCISS